MVTYFNFLFCFYLFIGIITVTLSQGHKHLNKVGHDFNHAMSQCAVILVISKTKEILYNNIFFIKAKAIFFIKIKSFPFQIKWWRQGGMIFLEQRLGDGHSLLVSLYNLIICWNNCCKNCDIVPLTIFRSSWPMVTLCPSSWHSRYSRNLKDGEGRWETLENVEGRWGTGMSRWPEIKSVTGQNHNFLQYLTMTNENKWIKFTFIH